MDLRVIVADVVESYKAEGKPLPEPRDLVTASASRAHRIP